MSWLLRPTAYYHERGLVPSRYCKVGVPKFYPITIVEFFVGHTRVYQFSLPIFNIRPSSRAHSHDDRMPLRSRLVPSLLGVSILIHCNIPTIFTSQTAGSVRPSVFRWSTRWGIRSCWHLASVFLLPPVEAASLLIQHRCGIGSHGDALHVQFLSFIVHNGTCPPRKHEERGPR